MIEAVEVERDSAGGFTHPEWGGFCDALEDMEDIPMELVRTWEKANGCLIQSVRLEETVDEGAEAWAQYWAGEGNFSKWPLHPPSSEAVLLSVHDTEDGPVQLWALPNRAQGTCKMPPLEQPRMITGHAIDAARGDMGQAVLAHGDYSPGGAQNHYIIGVGAESALMEGGGLVLGCLSFQEGHPDEVGPNGVTLEAVLAVCGDRLARFQEGPHANGYNASALQGIERALEALKDRTRERDHNSGMTPYTQYL